MSLRIAGFYTNLKYRTLADKMKASVEALGYPVSLYEMPHWEDEGTAWGFALRHKPTVVERCMLEHPEDDILYMDADAEMVQHPAMVIEDKTCDVAVNFIRPKHIHGCVMFFRGAKGLEYVRKWKESYQLYPHIRLDEIHAYFALKEMQKVPGFRCLTLPFSYTWVPWTAGRLYPTAKPIIIHHGEGRGPDKDTVLREASFHLPV
jgi:hypothetical protein